MPRQTRLPRRASLAAALLLCWGGAFAAAPHDHPEPVVLAPGYSALEFQPPAAGSYRLPPMGTAADGTVVDTQGRQAPLYSHLGDKLTVLSFIYTTCNDVNGCPLATYVMKGVQDAILEDTVLRDKVRLISFSFDPANDTPDVLHDYGNHFKQAGFDWRFLTTRSADDLDPILDAYGQWVIRDYDQEGNYLGTMSHILRVFLIDEHKRIRNIYSTSFLHADTVANDLRTLAMQ